MTRDIVLQNQNQEIFNLILLSHSGATRNLLVGEGNSSLSGIREGPELSSMSESQEMPVADYQPDQGNFRPSLNLASSNPGSFDFGESHSSPRIPLLTQSPVYGAGALAESETRYESQSLTLQSDQDHFNPSMPSSSRDPGAFGAQQFLSRESIPSRNPSRFNDVLDYRESDFDDESRPKPRKFRRKYSKF